MEAFANSYEATATLSGAGSSINYRVVFADDCFTLIRHYNQVGETAFYYEKGEGNTVNRKMLAGDNTVTAAAEKNEVWGEGIYVNALKDLTFMDDKTEVTLGESSAAQVKLINGQLCPLFKSMLLTPASARLYYEDDAVKYESIYESDDEITLTATFARAESALKLSPAETTAQSQALDARLTALKAGNYTLNVYEGQLKAATLEIVDGKIYVKSGSDVYGYNRTASGYNMVSLKNLDGEDKFYLTGEEEKEFASLLPTFAFAAAVLDYKDGTYSPDPAVKTSDIANAFRFVDWQKVVFENEFTLTLADDKLTIVSSSVSPAVTYRLEFTNIGSTTLTRDVSVYATQVGWDDGMTAALTEMLGDAEKIPFCTTTLGAEWSFDIDTDYIEATKEFGDIEPTDEQINAAIAEYCALLETKGYKKLTVAELEDLETRSGLKYKEDDKAYFVGVYDDIDTATVYWIDATHTVEIGRGFFGITIAVYNHASTYKNWAKVDIKSALAFKKFVGAYIPYLDTGFAWTMDVDDTDGEWFEFLCEDVPENKYAEVGAAYVALLEAAGYTRLTAAEIEAGVDYYADTAEDAVVYRINDNYVIEVCAGTSYYGGLFLNVTFNPAAA